MAQSYTATQLGYRAMRHLGCLRSGQPVPPDLLADILLELNDMIDAWTVDRRKILAVQPVVYALIPGQQQYSIGPGGAFNGPRPLKIEDVNIILNTSSPAVRMPVQTIDRDQWAAIPVQQIPYAIPLVMWYDHGFDASSHANINLWPGPQSNYQLELFIWPALSQWPDLVTPIGLAPAYSAAIALSLAEKIAPMMQVYLKIANPLTSEVKEQAAVARAAVESYNAPQVLMAVDPAIVSAGGKRGAGFGYLDGWLGGR